MTAKEQLLRAVDGLTEDEAVEVLVLVSQSRELDGATATRVLDGIDGAFERAELGLGQSRAGQTSSLDELALS